MFSEVGAILVSFGAIICIGAILKFTLDILELQMKSKKKVLDVLNGSFLSSLVGGDNILFNFFRGGNLKKKVWKTLI